MPENTRSSFHCELTQLALAAGLTLVSDNVLAQTAPATAALPTVTVTGAAISPLKADVAPSRKFTAPLIDTPKTVTVINEEVIRQTGSTSLTEALRTTPGITFGAGEGGNPIGDRPFLRGSDSQSSMFVDGMRDIGARSRDLFNVEAVEVIKGSDSAYAGRGGAGGSINLQTKKAQAENFISGDVGLGTDSYKRGTLDLNHKLSDTIGVRLNAMAHDADVPGRNGPDSRRWGVAPTVTFGMGTPTEVTLAYEHVSSDETPDTGIPYSMGNVSALTTPTFIKPTYGGNRDNWWGLAARDFRKERSDMLTASIEHRLTGTNRIRNLTRWSKGKQDYVWTQPDDSQNNIINGQVWRRMNSRYSENKTLQNLTEFTGATRTGSIGHQFAVGLELAREKSDVDGYGMVDAGGNVIPNTNQCVTGLSPYMCTSLSSPNGNDPWTGHVVRNNTFTHYKTNTAALYAFDTLALTPQWLINAGLRYDRYSTRQWNETDAHDRDDNLLNYQLGVLYKLRPDASIYASVGTSSTPGGGTLGQGSEGQSISPGGRNTTLNADELKPEKTRSYELGTKWDVLDRQLSLTAALFRNETTNVRIRDPLTSLASMAGKKVVNGIELGFSGRVTRQWDVFGGYTYMDSEQKKIGVTAAGIPNAGTGEAFPNTPRHSFSLWTNYGFTPRLTVGVGAFGQSAVVGGYSYSGNNSLIKKGTPGYVRYDAMASYALNKNLIAQLNLYNLTDKVYYNTAYAAHYAGIGAGRSAVASLKFIY